MTSKKQDWLQAAAMLFGGLLIGAAFARDFESYLLCALWVLIHLIWQNHQWRKVVRKVQQAALTEDAAIDTAEADAGLSNANLVRPSFGVGSLGLAIRVITLLAGLSLMLKYSWLTGWDAVLSISVSYFGFVLFLYIRTQKEKK